MGKRPIRRLRRRTAAKAEAVEEIPESIDSLSADKTRHLRELFFFLGRDVTRHAVFTLGLQEGLRVLMSGVFNELFRHLPRDVVRQMVVQIFETMPDDKEDQP